MALKEAYPSACCAGPFGVPLGTLYYRSKGPNPEEAVLRAACGSWRGAWPRYGYQRLAALLQGGGLRGGGEGCAPLMRREGLLLT
jgi:putative transposase